ncbi:MAG: lasso peptide biosynthesis B2 protein [Acidobacteriia bacterium]|nr:lasso peptide biosynthesis B2 protein [Terriglobia bacterium]
MRAADRSLLIRAVLVLMLTRWGLAWLGYAKLRRLLSDFRRARHSATKAGAEEVERIVWAVRTAGRMVLGARPCLPLAMATQWLLWRRGILTDLRIGVMRDEAGHLDAHAWVEQDGRILIGESPALERFERLPALSLWT